MSWPSGQGLHRDEVARCQAHRRPRRRPARAGARVLTHCNAGALATGGYGTALGVIRAAHAARPGLHVWVDETRPLLQGARLTAWELRRERHRGDADRRRHGGLADGAGRRSTPSSPERTGSPQTATPRTRSAPTGWRCSRARTASRSTSPRPRRPSTSPSRAAARSRSRSAAPARSTRLSAGAARGCRRRQPGLRRDARRVRDRDRHRARRAPAAVPVQLSAPDVNELRALLERHGQEQLLRFWDELDAGERARLAADVGEIDLDLMDDLVASLLDRAESIDPRTVEPPDVVRPGPRGRRHRPRRTGGRRGGGRDRRRRPGDAARFRRPEGDASRSARSPTEPFQIHAEKIVALGLRHGAALPLLRHDEPARTTTRRRRSSTSTTRSAWSVCGCSSRARCRRSTATAAGSCSPSAAVSRCRPDGHGGTYPRRPRAVRRLDDMADSGVRTIFYFQVDNPLVAIGDPGSSGCTPGPAPRCR